LIWHSQTGGKPTEVATDLYNIFWDLEILGGLVMYLLNFILSSSKDQIGQIYRRLLLQESLGNCFLSQPFDP
jgi:lipid-A-disaccharide synthase-like uncharacterized protein